MAADLPVWNPSFDVTPGDLIHGIITERGLVPRAADAAPAAAPAAAAPAAAAASSGGSGGGENGIKPFAGATARCGVFGVREWLQGLGLWAPPATAAAAAAGGGGAASGAVFEAFDAEGVRAYVAARPALAARVGPPSTAPDWAVREVGDGNINFVCEWRGWGEGCACVWVGEGGACGWETPCLCL